MMGVSFSLVIVSGLLLEFEIMEGINSSLYATGEYGTMVEYLN